MSDTQQPEPQPEASEQGTPRYETAATRDEVVVRRSPRYGIWMIAGAVLGALVAFVLSFAFAPTEAQVAERVQNDFTYDQGQVFGFLLLGGVAFGVALGALVALIVDRAMSRRTTRAVAEHDETHRVDG
ncbi:hypothetical protein MUN74_11135 [Agromyces endophyticus]|uniref:hypothetical protein n=1 Tax=Agromyces sp. H17E-10 TaxID=2932244 RepID=UPI001FD2D8C2|nr:hypothetical protein [Agromyces sp. H17E-10]UOQ87854.1 hypothetical protein MUN74_11135 [Agromyces sp. H17E-10]